eukprot:m.64434 g.64434  ORF g.64434 m.64434 type:complete len:394 (-) comp9718_c0_seq1:1834-3015(-)
MSRRAEIHSHARQKAKMEAELLSGELRIVRPPSPDSMPPGAVKVHGNPTTMNMSNILFTNVTDSLYLKNDCAKIENWKELVDEIYLKVENLQPFISNSGNQASSAFCLLYALFCLRPTKKQLIAMLNHGDSPYIRAIGFLFLRFVAPPKDLLDWCWDYLNDDEPITLQERGQGETTIGKFVRQILTDCNFLGTRFPRIPVLIEKSIQEELAKNPYVHGAAADLEGGAADHDADVRSERSFKRSPSPSTYDRDRRERSRDAPRRSRSRDRDRDRERTSKRSRSRERHDDRAPRRSRSRDRDRDRGRRRSRSRDRDYDREGRDYRRERVYDGDRRDDSRRGDRRDDERRRRDYDYERRHRDHSRDRDSSRSGYRERDRQSRDSYRDSDRRERDRV